MAVANLGFLPALNIGPGIEDIFRIRDLAGEVACICASAQVVTDRLRAVGFAEVASANELQQQGWQERSWKAEIIAVALVVRIGGLGSDVEVQHELQAGLQCCGSICGNEARPTTIVLLVVPADNHGGQGASSLPDEPMLAQEFFERGADDVVILQQGQERLTDRWLQCIALRTEMMAKRVDAHAVKVETQARRALHAAGRKFLWGMPGTALPSLPKQDQNLKEWVTEQPDGNKCEGVGDFTFVSLLGKGGFGSVIKAQHPRHGLVAVKAILKTSLNSAGELLSLDRECCLLLHLPPSPYLVQGVEVLHTQKYIYVVMSLAGELSLDKYIKRVTKKGKGNYANMDTPGMLVEDFVDFFKHQNYALGHLHRAKVCHRDLKPANYIVSFNEAGEHASPTVQLKLTDFGLATIVASASQTLKESCGSVPFCAPEVLLVSENGGYNGFTVDMWSHGINFLELMFGEYACERALGWGRQPRGPQLVADLQRLPAIFLGSGACPVPLLHHDGNEERFRPMLKALARVMVLNSDDRAGIDEFTALSESLLESKKLSPPPRNEVADMSTALAPLQMRTMRCFSGSRSDRVEQRPLPAELLQSFESFERSAPLSDRLGGASVIHLALGRLFDSVLCDPVLRPLFDRFSGRIPEICSHMKNGMACYLYPPQDSPFADSLDAKIRTAHHGLVVGDSAFDDLLFHVREAFQSVGISSVHVDDAVARFAAARSLVTSGWLARRFKARQNTASADWWAGAKRRVSQMELARFANILTNVASPDQGPDQSLWQAGAVQEHVLHFLEAQARGGQADAGWLPVPNGMSPTAQDLWLRRLLPGASHAAEAANFPVDVTEALLQWIADQSERARVLRKLDEHDLAKRSSSKAWDVISGRVHTLLRQSSKTASMSERGGMGRCLHNVRAFLTGDHKGANIDALAAAHKDLPLNHSHFDLFLNAFAEACVDSADQSFALAVGDVLSSLRPLVLREPMQRLALARVHVPPLPPDAIESLVPRIVSRLHELMAQDERLARFFPENKLQNMVHAHNKIFRRMLDGTMSLEAERCLALKHRKWRIHDSDFDRFVEMTRQSLDECWRGTCLQRESILGRLEGMRDRVVTKSQHITHGELPQDIISSAKREGSPADPDIVFDAALRVLGKNEAFADLCQLGALSAPCKGMAMKYALRQESLSAEEAEVIRQAHAPLQFSAAQFSAMRSSFEQSMQEFQVDVHTMGQVKNALDRLETPLTNDHAKHARAAVERTHHGAIDQEAFLSLVGECPGVGRSMSQALQRFQELLQEQPVLRPLGEDQVLVKCAAGVFRMLGLEVEVPADGSLTNAASLQQFHAQLAIAPQHVTAFHRCLRRALADTGFPAPVVALISSMAEMRQPLLPPLAGSG